MKTIQLTILRSTIIDAVKSETLITSNADRAADEKATRLAYQEAVGDDDFVERKLERDMLTAAEELKTFFSDYVMQSKQSTADNAVMLDMSDNAAVKYRMLLSDRFNDSYVDSLARLGSDFIKNKMLMLWWENINPQRAEIFFNLSDKVLSPIMRCFNRLPPQPPVYPYPKKIKAPASPQTLKKGNTYKLTYSLKDGDIDDVEVSSLNLNVLSVYKVEDGVIAVETIDSGLSTIQLYSRHDPTVKNFVIINVTD